MSTAYSLPLCPEAISHANTPPATASAHPALAAVPLLLLDAATAAVLPVVVGGVANTAAGPMHGAHVQLPSMTGHTDGLLCRTVACQQAAQLERRVLRLWSQHLHQALQACGVGDLGVVSVQHVSPVQRDSGGGQSDPWGRTEVLQDPISTFSVPPPACGSLDSAGGYKASDPQVDTAGQLQVVVMGQPQVDTMVRQEVVYRPFFGPSVSVAKCHLAGVCAEAKAEGVRPVDFCLPGGKTCNGGGGTAGAASSPATATERCLSVSECTGAPTQRMLTCSRVHVSPSPPRKTSAHDPKNAPATPVAMRQTQLLPHHQVQPQQQSYADRKPRSSGIKGRVGDTYPDSSNPSYFHAPQQCKMSLQPQVQSAQLQPPPVLPEEPPSPMLSVQHPQPHPPALPQGPVPASPPDCTVPPAKVARDLGTQAAQLPPMSHLTVDHPCTIETGPEGMQPSLNMQPMAVEELRAFLSGGSNLDRWTAWPVGLSEETRELLLVLQADEVSMLLPGGTTTLCWDLRYIVA
jgi:hypothetical protein